MSDKPVLIVDKPIPGFYWTKMVRGGPRVPVRIWWDYPIDPETGETMDRSPTLKAERNGQSVDPYEVWIWCADKPITEQEYRDMRPASAPETKIDMNSNDTVF